MQSNRSRWRISRNHTRKDNAEAYPQATARAGNRIYGRTIHARTVRRHICRRHHMWATAFTHGTRWKTIRNPCTSHRNRWKLLEMYRKTTNSIRSLKINDEKMEILKESLKSIQKSINNMGNHRKAHEHLWNSLEIFENLRNQWWNSWNSLKTSTKSLRKSIKCMEENENPRKSRKTRYESIEINAKQ